MDDFERELKAGFLDEAEQLLTDSEQCFLNIEGSKDDPEIIDKLFRLAHSLKGSARAVGFMDMGAFTHELESLLLKIKKKETIIDTPIVNLLLRCNDHLKEMITALKADFSATVDSSVLIVELSSALAGQLLSPTKTGSANHPEKTQAIADSKFSDVLVQGAAQASPTVLVDRPDSLPPPKKTVATPKEAVADENIRVSLKKLEQLLNNVGEMVILQTVLSQGRHHVPSPMLQKTIVQLSKISKSIQDVAMSLRMVPVKQTFQKMQRIVRDTSVALGKKVNFLVEGEETELDKTVLDHLGDPLVHLIRNAVDHGVETPDDRVKAGKSDTATVWLKAFHQGGHIVIEIKDDGKGMDAGRIRAKAIEKGLISESSRMSDREIVELIFKPGFSTKTEVTDISGRGVGLDVVKTNIEILQGEVQIETALGRGSVFRIFLPLTLAIIDGLLLQTGRDRYVIPLSQMFESVRPTQKEISYLTGVGETLSLRGEVLPLFRIEKQLGLKVTALTENPIAIVVRSGDHPFAVLVDDIIGQQQVVIKRLGAELSGIAGITGGAILGDGRPALILDLPELVGAHRSASQSTQLRGAA
jgi:two-component system, chemotaxis family, sensor kinase CheA